MALCKHVIINVSNVESYLVVSWYALLIGAIIHSIMVDVVYVVA